jgi:phospholipase/carboxylesterase
MCATVTSFVGYKLWKPHSSLTEVHFSYELGNAMTLSHKDYLLEGEVSEMKRSNLGLLIFLIASLGILVSCKDDQDIPVGDNLVDNEDTAISDEPTAVSDETLAVPTVDSTSVPVLTDLPLPERSGPRTQTSGTVPHVQIGVKPVTAVNDELFRRAFALPGVENRPTIVSLPGARGMWISDDIALAHPEAIVSGREFAHIHPDGSLHTPLPYERALEVAEKGWGERHPWADEREGWDGLVMLFTPQSMAELDIIIQLIVESYNHVTGQAIQATDLN